MISKSVTVNIFGQLSKYLYSGYISGDISQKGSVYVLTRRPMRDFVRGIVIATAVLEGTKEEKLIVAPEGEIFYEPEIKLIISGFKNKKITKILCLYEKSCGAVVFHRNVDGIKILLVKNHNGRHWSFPKGHVELGENEELTAKREIKEETNLDVEIYDSFREVTDYSPYGKIRKHVVFFLAESKSEDVTIQESEIDSYMWVTPAQAHNFCAYENDHKLIDLTTKFLSKG